MTADAHKAAAKVKAEIPDRTGQAESKASELSNRAGSKASELSSKAGSEYDKACKTIIQFRDAHSTDS